MVAMRESTDHANDDTVLGTKAKGPKNHDGSFRRTMSEINVQHLKHMEKNYSKLGDPISKKKENQINGKIKVASLNSLHVNGKCDGILENGFAGRRDVTKPESIKERQIVSRRGSIRGCKNRVKAGIATFQDQTNGYTDVEDEASGKRNYRISEKGKIIVYTTSMTVVRATADQCTAVRKILQGHMVRYEEKDLFMSAENQKELLDRLGQSAIHVPQVFADGIHIGGFDEIQEQNEIGELRNIFENFTKIQVRSSCDKCGGYRYLPCTQCHGSKKSLLRNEFTEEFCALRCMQCDENGLMRCDDCIDQQE